VIQPSPEGDGDPGSDELSGFRIDVLGLLRRVYYQCVALDIVRVSLARLPTPGTSWLDKRSSPACVQNSSYLDIPEYLLCATLYRYEIVKAQSSSDTSTICGICSSAVRNVTLNHF
jgi:hypothetical protein